MTNNKTFPLPLFALLCVYSAGCYVNPTHKVESYATQAEELYQEGAYLKSIEAYQKHIDQRLRTSNRAPAENPYFYQLFIGDNYLKLKSYEQAKTAYQKAADCGVDSKFVADRFLRLGRQLSEDSSLDDNLSLAIESLKLHRDLDPLIFDAEIDRIHRLSVQKEQELEDSKPEL